MRNGVSGQGEASTPTRVHLRISQLDPLTIKAVFPKDAFAVRRRMHLPTIGATLGMWAGLTLRGGNDGGIHSRVSPTTGGHLMVVFRVMGLLAKRAHGQLGLARSSGVPPSPAALTDGNPQHSRSLHYA
jgi:hypothetical protein